MPRRKRNADQPKRAMTAYMLFCQEKRSEIKEKNPDVGFGQIGKLLGEAWKELSETEKAKYNEVAAKDKIRAQKEMAAYKEEHPESSEDEKEKKKPPKKKRKKDPNAPKKPSSAYFHFSKKMRPKIKEDNPTATFGEIGKLLGEAWKKATEEEKKEFSALAEEDKKRYEKENKAYAAKKKDSSSSDSSSSDSDSDSDSSSSSSDSEESD